jgi:hypothetical protein
MADRTDPLIAKHEQAELDAYHAARAANLFDVRRFIGGLFAIYGLILTVMGIGASDAQIDRAAGVNVNLWTGLAMLAVAALFVFWAFARPLADQLEEAEEEPPPAEADRAARGAPAPAGADEAALAGSETAGRGPRSDREGIGGRDGPGGEQR